MVSEWGAGLWCPWELLAEGGDEPADTQGLAGPEPHAQGPTLRAPRVGWLRPLSRRHQPQGKDVRAQSRGLDAQVHLALAPPGRDGRHSRV